MVTSGAGSGRSWWAINAAILLVFPFVLNSCSTPAAASSFSPDPGNILITVQGADGTPLSHGVVVRVTSSTQSDGEDNDAFKLESCTIGQFITAWAPGHQVGFVPCDGMSTSYTVPLESLADVRDNPDYVWLPATNCSQCHAGQYGGGYDEYREWSVTGHAKGFGDNRYFESLYPAGAMNCAACHAPTALLQNQTTADLTPTFSSAGNSLTEGITCDVCHKVNGVYLENNLYPFADKPGIRSFQLVRSDSFTIGPFSNIIVPFLDLIGTNHSMCSNIFSKSEFCAVCHYGRIGDTLVYRSYKEWREGIYGNDPTSNEYRTCQDCHMSYRQPNGGNRNSYRSACSETEAGFQDFNHNMMDFGLDSALQREIPRMIRGAAVIGATFEYSPPENLLRVHVTVQNVKTGHNFPTDSPLRHLILVLEAKDQFSNVLMQVEGTQIPTLGGINNSGVELTGFRAYAGWPGKIYVSSLLQEATSLPPDVAYWNQFQPQQGLVNNSANAIASLGARGLDFSTYAFSAPVDGEVNFTISLLYRFGFYDLMQQKHWTDNPDRMDIPVMVLRCLGNAARPEYFKCDQVQ